MKKIGCLHAHYSNIDYIESSFASYDIELIHFVDPALMYLVTSDGSFTNIDAQRKVKEQIEWIAKCNVDAILITCTNYIAVLKEDISIAIPIIKIDEPFFEHICNTQLPQTILFTNPATVTGTMDRLKQYADRYQKSINVKAIVIDNAFDFIMKGHKKEYNQTIIKFLNNILEEEKYIAVAQLSMVDASREVEGTRSQPIKNPLDPLLFTVIDQLNIGKKT